MVQYRVCILPTSQKPLICYVTLGEFSAHLGHFICCSEALWVSDSPKYNQAKSSTESCSGYCGGAQSWWWHTELVGAHRAGDGTQSWWGHTELVGAHRAGGGTQSWVESIACAFSGWRAGSYCNLSGGLPALCLVREVTGGHEEAQKKPVVLPVVSVITHCWGTMESSRRAQVPCPF